MRKRTMATILVLSLLLTLTAPALATKEELTAETLGYTPANELLSEDGDMLVTIDPAIKAALDRDYAYLQNENGSYSVKSLGDVNNLSLYASAVETADEFITEPLEIVDLSVLQFCTQLEYVFIDSRSISGLAALSNAKKVRSISLTSAQLNDLFNISSIPKLDSLRFTNCQIADYSDLSKCKALTNLTISDNELRDLSFVPQIKKLSMLDISGVPNADFSTLTDLKKLYGLIINMENAASGSLEWEIIGRCEGYVNLFNLTSLTKKDVESHLSTPYQLDFTYNEPPEAPIDLFAIQYAKSLDMLTFYKANIGDLSFIANCKKLNSLAFYGCVLQKSGHLWNAPKLVDLFIHNCKVNDPGLFFAGIARAKKLRCV